MKIEGEIIARARDIGRGFTVEGRKIGCDLELKEGNIKVKVRLMVDKFSKEI